MPDFTARQRRFVEELLVDDNQTQAAIRAGFSTKSAKIHAVRLMAMPHVIEAVAKARAERSERTKITADRVLTELAKIGFADIRKAVAWKPFVTELNIDEETGESRMSVTNQVQIVASDEIDDQTAAAIAEISQSDKGGLKIKMHDKRAALVDIGRHLGMFVERHEVTGKGGAPLVPTIIFEGNPKDGGK